MSGSLPPGLPEDFYARIIALARDRGVRCILDADGEPTTHLTRMATMGKDNRLLPEGWDVDGPHTEDTKAVGVDGDPDFTGGSDLVHFEIPCGAEGPVRVIVWLLYQPVPPHWVQALRDVDYRGWVSVEVFDYTPGIERLALESIQYMQRCLKELAG